MRNRLLLLFLLLFIFSCENDDDDVLQDDHLPYEIVLFLDSLGVQNVPLDSIKGFDGESLADRSSYRSISDAFVNRLLKKAVLLSDEKDLITHQSEGDNKPMHNGIAYAYGGDDFSIRQFPKEGNKLHKSYAVFGTDCSGFIHFLIDSEIANTPDFPVSGFESTLKRTLSSHSFFKNMLVENKGNLPISKIKNGDFILWRGHMGIVAETMGGRKLVYQSNGTEVPKDIYDQIKNWGLGRGVHPLNLVGMIQGDWGNKYSIIRLSDKKFSYRFRPSLQDVSWSFPFCSTTCSVSFKDLYIDVDFDYTQSTSVADSNGSYSYSSFMQPPFTSQQNPICFYTAGQSNSSNVNVTFHDEQNGIGREQSITMMYSKSHNHIFWLNIYRSSLSSIDSAKIKISAYGREQGGFTTAMFERTD